MYDFISKNQAILVTDKTDREYFSGVCIDEGYLLLTNKAVYLTDARYFGALTQKLTGSRILPLLYNGNEDIAFQLKNQKIKKLFIDFDKTNVSDYLEYKKFGVKICDGSGIIKEIKSIKSQKEIETIKKACDITQKTFHKVILGLKAGDTELEIKTRIENTFSDLGADGVAFDTIVAFGKNSAVPHHQSDETVLNSGMPILIDMGCKYKGYCSDLTRMAFMGTPDKEFLENYDSVLNANELSEKKIESGMSSVCADAVARDYLKTKNLDKYFTHSLGHGIGMEIHEFPYLSPKRNSVLKEDMVFSIEPGVYFDGKYGIRIEDTVMIKNGKVVRLFDDEKNLIIL